MRKSLLVLLFLVVAPCLHAQFPGWDPVGDATHPDRILRNGEREGKKAVDTGADALHRASVTLGLEKPLDTGHQILVTTGLDKPGETIHGVGNTLGLNKPGDTFEMPIQTVSAVTDAALTATTFAIQQSAMLAENSVKEGRIVASNIAREGGQAVKGTSEMLGATYEFTIHQVQSVGVIVSDADRRIREGKIVDAMFHVAVDPFQHSQDDAAEAFQKSDYLRTVAQVGASTYGGPYGAAAFAAWYTYKQTKDADLALRVGMITGAASLASKAVDKMPTATMDQITEKAIIAGSVGGLAVAAGGGDETAIQKGVLLGCGRVVIEEGYKQVTWHKLDPHAANGEAYNAVPGTPTSAPDEAYLKDENGKIILDEHGRGTFDVRYTEAQVNHVGIQSETGKGGIMDETGPVMPRVAEIPGMNAMAVFHDRWSMAWQMGGTATKVTIPPAIYLTYMGTEAPLDDHIQKKTVEPKRD